jgi:hypothetical protein
MAVLPAISVTGNVEFVYFLRREAFLGNCLAALAFFVTFLGQAKKVKACKID